MNRTVLFISKILFLKTAAGKNSQVTTGRWPLNRCMCISHIVLLQFLHHREMHGVQTAVREATTLATPNRSKTDTNRAYDFSILLTANSYNSLFFRLMCRSCSSALVSSLTNADCKCCSHYTTIHVTDSAQHNLMLICITHKV